MAWINPNSVVSLLINLPDKSSELEAGGSTDKEVEIQSMFVKDEIHNLDPGVRLQIRLRDMLDPYFEEYIEYVLDWMPLEILMRQNRP